MLLTARRLFPVACRTLSVGILSAAHACYSMRTDVPLDLLHELHIILRHERHGLARAARAARPAHAVHVPTGVLFAAVPLATELRAVAAAAASAGPVPVHGVPGQVPGPVPVPGQVPGQCQCRECRASASAGSAGPVPVPGQCRVSASAGPFRASAG